jgi:oxygen-independent coproporphyrinogen III oxidase
MKLSLLENFVAGIYLHIPFCKQACYYCDFHFSTNRSQQSQLVSAINSELHIQKKYLQDEEVKTIYFGGGTPSLLTSAELASILNSIKSNYRLTGVPEITLEVNPDDIDEQSIYDLSALGFNRLSIGVQSFHDPLLQYLNRAHTVSSASESFQLARQAGFSNISIDLIYAIPGLSDDDWKKGIHHAIDLSPEHISAYSLTIEEKTVFGNRASKGTLTPVDDDSAARQLEILMTELENAGFEQYEISNFCRPGFQSKHNSSYWKQEMYLGIGPSAHSYNGSSRQFNVKNNSLYIKSIESGKVPYEIEILKPEDRINEYLLTTLRTSWGTDLDKLKSDFNHDILLVSKDYLQELFSQKLAWVDGHFLKLTKKGRLLADSISSDLFVLA